MDTQDTPEITDNTQLHRYELRVGGQLAGHIDYRSRGAALDLVHTEVGKAFEGRGLAAQLARRALDDARSQGRKVIPTCEYIASYIARHPEYRDLAAS